MKKMSTVDLINELKVGQRAKMNYSEQEVIVKRDAYYGIIIVEDKTGRWSVGQPLPLVKFILNASWFLLGEQISFATAVEHIDSGKEVICVYDDEDLTYDSMQDLIYIDQIANGKWYSSENNSSVD